MQKVKFMMDYGEYKAGDIALVSNEEAEDHHMAGRAYPFVEPEPKPKAEPKVEVKRGKK